MENDFTTIDGVIALRVPVPPMLERALGYTDRVQRAPARLIGFFWEPAGDEARCAWATNGRCQLVRLSSVCR